MELKHFALEELKAAEADDGTRTIEGFGSVFGNTDSYRDIVMPGAFTESLKARKPAMLWQHRSDMPIGVWDEMEETKKGLRIKGRILGTQAGNDAYLLAKEGAITGLSIGFSTKKFEDDEKKRVRKLIEVELYEVSLVTFPANEKATITHVKSRPDTIRAFEEYLREGGFSQRDATTVALHGFKALTTQGEPDEEELTALRDLAHKFNQINLQG